jgi:HAD superfamily hydrolase (TIGR01509 family)
VFDAILFDNDGVLVDTEGLYFQANREVLASVGVDLDQEGYVQWFLREARGAWHLAEARGLDSGAIETLRAARDRRYAALIEASDITVPGASEIVVALSARYRLALVTSSEPGHLFRAHERTGLLRHFPLVLAKGDYQRCKPDPDPYLRALERLGLAPERCLVIEDSARGLRAAKGAGLTCWVIPTALTRQGPFDGADDVLPDLRAAAARLL